MPSISQIASSTVPAAKRKIKIKLEIIFEQLYNKCVQRVTIILVH